MRQWWPNTRRPEGTGQWPQRPSEDAGFSGSISTTSNTAITSQRLCSRTFAKPMESTLELTCNLVSTVASTAVSPAWDLCAVNAVEGAGSVLIEYGSGGALARAVVDLRGGSYQLPPCEEVRVSVTTSVGSILLPALNIAGAIVPGRHSFPTVPTYTWAQVLATDDSVNVPPRARFVDLWLANETTSKKYGSGAPILSMCADGSQAQLIRDYTTGIWAPPFPVPCMPAGALDTAYKRRLLIATTVACTAVVQFEIAL